MLCRSLPADPEKIHPELYATLIRVDDMCRKVSGNGLTAPTIALLVVAWQDSYPKLKAYREL